MTFAYWSSCYLVYDCIVYIVQANHNARKSMRILA